MCIRDSLLICAHITIQNSNLEFWTTNWFILELIKIVWKLCTNIWIEQQELNIYLQFSNPLCFSSDVTRNWYMCQSLNPLYIELSKSTTTVIDTITSAWKIGAIEKLEWHSYNKIMIEKLNSIFVCQNKFNPSFYYPPNFNICVTFNNSRWKYDFKYFKLIKYQTIEATPFLFLRPGQNCN